MNGLVAAASGAIAETLADRADGERDSAGRHDRINAVFTHLPLPGRAGSR